VPPASLNAAGFSELRHTECAYYFPHAAEVEKILMHGKTPRRAGAGSKVNAEFAEFLEQRRTHRRPRIRWRRFDRNGDGLVKKSTRYVPKCEPSRIA
jgi:hypothetical protein